MQLSDKVCDHGKLSRRVLMFHLNILTIQTFVDAQHLQSDKTSRQFHHYCTNKTMQHFITFKNTKKIWVTISVNYNKKHFGSEKVQNTLCREVSLWNNHKALGRE